MLSYMTDYYQGMKNEVGIDPGYSGGKDDANLDSLVQKLRPNSTAQNFRQFMTVRK